MFSTTALCVRNIDEDEDEMSRREKKNRYTAEETTEGRGGPRERHRAPGVGKWQ